MTAHRDPRLPAARMRWYPEPKIRFAHEQLLEDPKDGLLLFGPPPHLPAGISYGVIGIPEGLRQFEAWAGRLGKPILPDPKIKSSVTFPGFEAAFRVAWPAKARVTCQIDEARLLAAIRLSDAHQRVCAAVDLYASAIQRWVTEEDPKVSLWFVVVPEELWKLCRPKSVVAKGDATTPVVHLSHTKALELIHAPSLFDDDNEAAEKHLYENHFHNQLKAKLLECEAVTQLIRQSTIAPDEHLNRAGKRARQLQDDATVAWNLATAIYYKAGSMPWTLAGIRDGVCYVGLVFKKTNNPLDKSEACCGAQMFLHSGEGIVFKGAVGAWATDRPGEFHLPKVHAAAIVRECIAAYETWHGCPPRELFIHGRTAFGKDEIEGFHEGAGAISVTGIQIRKAADLKLFRDGRRAVLRGIALMAGARSAYLWTAGYVPHLQTYPGREVPSPLKVKRIFGEAEMDVVLSDVLALTKVNFNTCIYSDGMPVTLRFADDVGEILTAIPNMKVKRLPFRNYI